MKPITAAQDSAWRMMLARRELDGRPVIFFEKITSTSTIALEEGKKGAPDGTLVVAAAQDKGRGRLGKSWLSPRDSGLYFSLIKRPGLQPADLPKITLAAGLAVCRALEKQLGLTPRLKWPNDILLAEKKCGGILTESTEIRANSALVVIGVGLNLTAPPSAFPGELREKITFLDRHLVTLPDKGTLLLYLVREIEEVIARLEQGKFAEILGEWKKRDATVGKILTWLTPGGTIVTGISQGPDMQGQLHIRDAEGTLHAVLSGDISLCANNDNIPA